MADLTRQLDMTKMGLEQQALDLSASDTALRQAREENQRLKFEREEIEDRHKSERSRVDGLQTTLRIKDQDMSKLQQEKVRLQEALARMDNHFSTKEGPVDSDRSHHLEALQRQFHQHISDLDVLRMIQQGPPPVAGVDGYSLNGKRGTGSSNHLNSTLRSPIHPASPSSGLHATRHGLGEDHGVFNSTATSNNASLLLGGRGAEFSRAFTHTAG